MLALFDALPLSERLFIRARLATAPLEEVCRHVPPGHVLDAGCGHGVLSALLALDPGRTVLGIDPDERKIELARASVGKLPNATFRVGTIEQLGEQFGLERSGRPVKDASPNVQFDAVVFCDVLYLLEHPKQALAAAARVLKPGGTLVLKEAEDDGSWRAKKTLLQEQIVVKLLGKTKSSGGLGFQPREVLEREVIAAGFTIKTVSPLGAGYTTPHVLICADKRMM